MKKLLLLLCCGFAASTAFAQRPTFGIKGGVNFAKTAFSIPDKTISTGFTTTFAAGLFADFKVGNNVSIQPALNYTGKGGKLSDFDSEGTTVDIKTYYLQVPVNVVYRVPVAIGNIYFGAGPYVGIGLSGKGKTTRNGNTESQDVKFGSDAPNKRTEYGLNGITGLEFKSGFLIGLNYDLGLTNTNNLEGTGVVAKNRVFGLSVGYKF
ncbi:PorT family protein [Mucilaginibacter sp. RB4R14]|uniref:porin family protein n=1 Tax=Mucilaginibacter aurantiaciroseus TaxID=2949308 RepID=UPI00209135FB|nr:porin family protein [Mucilaginibacter aurantiaciroseus]MCO5934413.1 PorT family protein [Mucilaginibacter aurantiaciroseus]